MKMNYTFSISLKVIFLLPLLLLASKQVKLTKSFQGAAIIRIAFIIVSIYDGSSLCKKLYE